MPDRAWPMLVGGGGQSQECSVYAKEVRVKRIKQEDSIRSQFEGKAC